MTWPAGLTGPGGMTGMGGPDPAAIVERALSAAAAGAGRPGGRPIEGVIVLVTVISEANLRWANSTATTSGMAESMEWSVISICDGAAGSVAGSVADADSPAGIEAVVRRSADAARSAAISGRNRDTMPLVSPADRADPGSEAGTTDFDLPADRTSFDVLSGVVAGLAQAFEDARSADELLYGFARHELATHHLGTSTGIRRRWVQPTGILEVNAKSSDLSRSAWSGASTADFTDVDVRATAAALHQRLGWAKRRVDLPAGRYDTVLPPTAVADFMVYLLWSAAGRPAQEGHSPFSAPGGGTRIGERLTTLPLTLATDPAAPGLATAPFVIAGSSSDTSSVFDNGAPVGRLELIADGAVAALAHTRGSAAEFDVPFTPATDNLILDGGETGCGTADLTRSLDRGLLVTSQWYLREVDPMTMLLTGLTRDGVFLVERGEVVGEVTNYRFNMSPLDVLRQASRVGTTERTLSREWSDWFTRSAMPPVLVEGFNMSSVSRAL